MIDPASYLTQHDLGFQLEASLRRFSGFGGPG
jgi:hypothetical protein